MYSQLASWRKVAIVFALVPLLQAAQAQPRRIVSTSPLITETLFALGLGPKVVGVSNYCRYPTEVVKLPKVGTFLKPDAELIARLSPDLVIIEKQPTDLAARLGILGIRCVAVEQGSLPELYSGIQVMGQVTGAGDQAKQLVSHIQSRLDAVTQKNVRLAKPKVLFLVGRRLGTLSDLVAVGSASYLNELIRIAGGVNVLAQPSMLAYPHISLETVIRLDPDFIIDTSLPMEDSEQDRTASETLWMEQKQLTAVRQQHVRMISSDAFVVPGPRITEVVELLSGILHGQGSR